MGEVGLEEGIRREKKGTSRHYLSGNWDPVGRTIGELANEPPDLHKPILFLRALKCLGSSKFGT